LDNIVIITELITYFYTYRHHMYFSKHIITDLFYQLAILSFISLSFSIYNVVFYYVVLYYVVLYYDVHYYIVLYFLAFLLTFKTHYAKILSVLIL